MAKMPRLNRLLDFWNWLPFFRAVAETEHLTEAAETLHKSPSAVSRAINLLEEELGEELFDRKGRNIYLNSRGRLFLRNLRSSMRLVDEAMRAVSEDIEVGSIILASPAYFSPFVSDALSSVYTQQNELLIETASPPGKDAPQALLKGDVDLVLTHAPIPDPELTIEQLGSISNRLFFPDDYSISDEEARNPDTWSERPMISLDKKGGNSSREGWPADISRRIDAYVDKLEFALSMARAHSLPMVLPTRMENHSGLTDFESVNLPFLEETPVYSVRRKRLVEEDAVDFVSAEIEKMLDETP